MIEIVVILAVIGLVILPLVNPFRAMARSAIGDLGLDPVWVQCVAIAAVVGLRFTWKPRA